HLTDARDLRDLPEVAPNTGVLLSALCIEDGILRPECLEDVSTLSIRKFLDKVLEEIRDNQRYGDIRRELNVNKDDVMPSDEVIAEKRFYSNW
ncbi:hypothetical protein DPMN_181351, partial [Dreissena polymorpha]